MPLASFRLARGLDSALERVGRVLARARLVTPAKFAHSARHALTKSYLENTVLVRMDLSQYSPAGAAVRKEPISPTPPAFVMWWQGEELAPPIVKACIASLRKNLEGFTPIVITAETYKSFTEIDRDLIGLFESGRISLTHFSDIVRVNLLKINGGVWVDATVLATAPTALVRSPDGFISRRGSPSPIAENVSAQRWSAYLLGGPRDLQIWPFLGDFFTTYWRHHTRMVDYHLIDYALSLAYDRDIAGFRSSIDNLPKSQPDIHRLSRQLRAPALGFELGGDLGETTLSKLSWKESSPNNSQTFGSTIYDAVIAEFGKQ
jgi:hypothetical protein